MSDFAKSQQELIDSFKATLNIEAERIINKFYTDVMPYAEIDANINFEQKLRDEIYAEIVQEIKSKHGHYSWAHSIRMALLKQHKEELQNKIIEDLQEKLKTIEQRYFDIVQRSRY